MEPLWCLHAGELGAMEAIMEQLMAKDLLKPLVLKALWLICSTSLDQLAAGQVGQQQNCTSPLGGSGAACFANDAAGLKGKGAWHKALLGLVVNPVMAYSVAWRSGGLHTLPC